MRNVPCEPVGVLRLSYPPTESRTSSRVSSQLAAWRLPRVVISMGGGQGPSWKEIAFVSGYDLPLFPFFSSVAPIVSDTPSVGDRAHDACTRPPFLLLGPLRSTG